MKRNILGIVVLAALLVVIAAQTAYHYVTLPAVVASEFDAAGNAQGFMSKGAFVSMQLLVTFLICEIPLVGFLPDRMLDLPHKDYWLAPQQRRQTRRWLTGVLLWLTNATLLFVTALKELICRANYRPKSEMGMALWAVVAAYLPFVAVMSVGLIRRFRRIPAESLRP